MSLHKEISFETETKGEPDSSPGYAGKLRCSGPPGSGYTRCAQTTPALIRLPLRYSPPHNSAGE